MTAETRNDRLTWDDYLGCFLVAVFALTLFGLVAACNYTPPQPTKPSVTLPTAEDVGKGVGRQSRGFLRGFGEGWRGEGKGAKE